MNNKLSEQTGMQFMIESKEDVARAMGELIKQPQAQERVQAEITAIYKASGVGATREERKRGMDMAIIDLATRAVLSDVMLTLLTNALPEKNAGGESALIQVAQ